jgi:hypothetical protein
MIYANGRCPIAELLRELDAALTPPTEFVLAGVGAFVPDDGEYHYLEDEARRFGLPVHRYPVDPTHVAVRAARTALGAGLLCAGATR